MRKNNHFVERLTPLIERAKKGDQEALKKLYARFLPMVLKHTNKMSVYYRQEAKEDLLVELLTAVNRFEPETDSTNEIE
jgi:DNA-directed RNA polymerase specialized sigma subunit